MRFSTILFLFASILATVSSLPFTISDTQDNSAVVVNNTMNAIAELDQGPPDDKGGGGGGHGGGGHSGGAPGKGGSSIPPAVPAAGGGKGRKSSALSLTQLSQQTRSRDVFILGLTALLLG